MHTRVFTFSVCRVMATLVHQWCSESVCLKKWQLAVCGLPSPAGPVGCSSQLQPAELLRGVLEFTRIIITLCSTALRGSLYVCVCACIFVCVRHIMACVSVSVWFQNKVTFSCISISHPIRNSYFGSIHPCVCFYNSAWEHKHTVNC